MNLLKTLSNFINTNNKKISLDIGEVTIINTIGQGGNGVVYEGILNDTTIAIKFLITDDDKLKQKKNLTRFIAEYINIITLSNKQYIVKYIDFDVLRFCDEEKAFEIPLILMIKYDYSLKSRKFANEVSDFDTFFYFLINSVDYIHRNGIIHRDLKPENILMKDGNYYLADFGIASFNPKMFKIRAVTDKKERLANRVFSAPEQEKTGVTPHPTMDIYAIGQLLQWFAFGEPHQGTGRKQIVDIYENKREVDYIIDKCLANDPSKRFQCIQEIKDYLESNLSKKKEFDPFLYLNIFNDICRRNFPKNEWGIVHCNNEIRIAKLLNDFKENLSEFHTNLWWHNGMSNLSIKQIRSIDNKIWRLGKHEYKIEEIWVNYDDSTYNDFIIIHYLPQEGFDVNGEILLSTVLLNDKHHITFSEFENGYAEIDDEIIDISEEKKEIIKRTDKEGYLIIATNFHCALTFKNDENIIELLSTMLERTLTIDELIIYSDRLLANKSRAVSQFLFNNP